VQERTQSQNFYESYYKTGEIKEKKYFSNKGRPFLLKTFKKNGKVKKERRL
jgi:antitoxin component YwqK of YwqJK toxin-antitoxin module